MIELQLEPKYHKYVSIEEVVEVIYSDGDFTVEVDEGGGEWICVAGGTFYGSHNDPTGAYPTHEWNGDPDGTGWVQEDTVVWQGSSPPLIMIIANGRS